MKGVTVRTELARWILRTEHADLPEEVRAAAKRALVNSVGTGIGGVSIASVGLADEIVADEVGDVGPCTVLVSGDHRPAGYAAFVNGVMINALGQEETHLASGTHPAETTVPIVLALGELAGSTGKQVIEALAIGMEVTAAMASMSLTPAVKYERCQAPSVYGTIGAVASAAKLLGLDEVRTENALSLAANFATGIVESVLAGSGEYHYLKGLVGLHANLAVRLARSGAIGAPKAFEGFGGFYHLFADIPGAAMADFDVAGDIGSRLGSEWSAPEFIYKPYPVNYFNLDFVDGAKVLRERHRIRSSDVKSIRIEMGERASKSGGLGTPPFTGRANTVSATQFCVAAMIVRGRLTLEDQLEYTSQDIIALCDLTEAVAVDGLSTARIRIDTSDGVFSWDAAEEGRDYRLGDSDIYRIFEEAASRTLPLQQVEELLEALMNIETARSLSDVLRLAVSPSQALSR